MSIEISVIIPTKDRLEILKATLKELLNSIKKFNYEIIVVNDSKTDNLNLSEVIVVNNPKSGAASARNYGASIAQGELLLFLDDDMIVNESALTQIIQLTRNSEKSIYLPNWEYPPLVKEALQKKSFGRFLNKINYTSLKGWIGKETIGWEKEKLYEHNGMASYCFLISKNDFIELGGYNESFPFAGFEDYDITKRLTNYRFYILPGELILHNENDRLEFKQFLERKKRNATTQRKAVEIGYSEFTLNYSIWKKLIFKTIDSVEKPLYLLLNNLPNTAFFDKLYFKLLSLLIAKNIYYGYNEAD